MRPFDAMEQCAEAATPLGVNAFDEGDAPGEVRAKARMADAILGVGSGADAVGEDGLQLVEIPARDVAALIDDKPGEMLAYAGAHEPGLAVVDVEAFFHDDGSDLGGQAGGVLCEDLIFGEREVVCIARVGSACRAGEPGETAVQPPPTEVCDGRRGGRALGQVRAAVKGPGYSQLLGIAIHAAVAPDVRRRGGGAEGAEQATGSG
jgi:hypothetical protein